MKDVLKIKGYETIRDRRFLTKLHNANLDTEANYDGLTAVAADSCIPMTQQEQATAEQRPQRNVERPVRFQT